MYMYIFKYVQKTYIRTFIFMTDSPPVYNTTISSSTTPDDLSGFDIIISWTVSMLVDTVCTYSLL